MKGIVNSFSKANGSGVIISDEDGKLYCFGATDIQIENQPVEFEPGERSKILVAKNITLKEKKNE